MSKPTTYQKNLYLYEGKKLGLSKIVQKLHPGSTPAEHKKYYSRYFTRIKNGATLEQAIVNGDQTLNQNSVVEQLIPEALPVATKVLEIPEVEVEAKDTAEEEYERALAYARNLYVTFRKYEGRTLAYVLQTEPTYIEWMRKKLVQGYSENPRDVTMLRGINQLYNDYPIAQDIIMKAQQAYYDHKNQENCVPAAISLADSPQLQKLTALSPLPIVETPVEMEEKGVCDFTGLAFEQLLTMQAEQQQESQALQEEQLEMDTRRLAIISRLQELDHSQALLTRRIEELTPKVPEVTDHAMVRYLERVIGMDVEDLKRQIVGFEDRSWLFDYQVNGSGRYVVSDTHRVHIENNTVVTVLPR